MPRVAQAAVLIAASLISAACQPDERILKSAPTPVPEASLEPQRTDLEGEVRDMETAGLENVFVVRRKDGGLFDDDDRKFLRENMPNEVNRRVAAEGGRAFVLGSAFIIPEKTVAKWRTRFNVEVRASLKGTPEPKP
jgi:hypothetical protein